MSFVRINITIPDHLARKLDRMVSPRKKSKFIVESLEEHIQRLEHEKLKNRLEEGYKVRRDEGIKIAGEFKTVDLEGWDEY